MEAYEPNPESEGLYDQFDPDLLERLARIDEDGAFEHYRPLRDAADEFIRFAEHPELRVRTGLTEIDAATRGVAPGELMLIIGFAHSGKTVLATELMMTNHEYPMVLFTPDETRPLVLTKLASVELGLSAEEIERRIFRQDEEARQQLLTVAEKYHKLAVYDENVCLRDMTRMFRDAEKALGAKPRAVLFDYADQLNEQVDTKAKIDLLKGWGKEHGVPLFLLHQTSRSGGGPGQALGLTSGAYGGDQQATFMVTVRRKKYAFQEQIRELEKRLDAAVNPTIHRQLEAKILDITENLIPLHRDTISIGMPKNKRPPSQAVEESDYKLDAATGRIVPLRGGEPPIPPPPLPGFQEGGGSATEFLRKQQMGG